MDSHKPPPPPPIPPTVKDTVDSFVSFLMTFRKVMQDDPKKLSEFCDYFYSEVRRFGELNETVHRNPEPEKIQEILNLNRRLSVMHLLLSYLR